MNTYRPISVSPAQRWRDIRTRVLPVVVFSLAVAVIAYLWQEEATPSVLLGEVHGMSEELYAPATGTVVQWNAAAFDEVEEGSIIAWVKILPEQRISAALEVLQAELALMQTGGAEPVLELQRNYMNVQSLRRDWLRARADVASLRVRLAEAEVNLQRLLALFERQGIAETERDLGQANVDALASELEEREALAALLETSVRKMEELPLFEEHDLGDTLEKALDFQESRLRQMEADLQPVPVVAPFTGVLTQIYRQSKAFIREGEPLARLSSRSADFILGYLKDPAPLEPTIGMRLMVSPIHSPRLAAESQILQVGARFDPLPEGYSHPFAPVAERALPLKISLPEGLILRPGERVEIRMAEGI